jgi:hypothetical protein
MYDLFSMHDLFLVHSYTCTGNWILFCAKAIMLNVNGCQSVKKPVVLSKPAKGLRNIKCIGVLACLQYMKLTT